MTANNLVTFLPIGGAQHLVLTLDGDWCVTGGLEADVNSATIPYTERAKLPPNLVYVSGTICLWGGVDPASGGEPEHALGNQWLVDCVAVRYGREPGDTADKATHYRLSFADHRINFRPPRGGRLCQGFGNPEPLGTATLRTCGELMSACLAACGVATGVPGSVNAVAPPRNLEWYGVHAPTELGRLLQHTGHVYCPYSAGGASVYRLGNGALPPIPPERLVSAVTASTVSRLPRRVVVTSSPNAEARTYNDQAGGAAPAWEFVVRDPANNYKWAELSAVSALGSDPAAALARDFPAASELDRKLLRDQLYKVIRLKDDRYKRLQCPVLRSVLYPDGREDQPHLVATVAVQGQDSSWSNVKTRLNASTVDGVDNLLAFDARLVKVKTGDRTAALETNCQAIAAADLKPAFTVEDFSGGVRYLSVFGFVLGLGIGSMGESVARSRLSGYYPDTAIIDAPDCRVVHLNDDTNNRDELEGRAQGVAGGLLVDTPDASTVEVTGFLPCQVDGRVNQVRYSQQQYRTTIVVDGWACPSRGGACDSGGGGHQASPFAPSDDPIRQQDHTPHAARGRAQATQARQGGLLARTPGAAASPVPPARTGFRPAFAKVGDAVAGGIGRFKGKTIDGRLKRDASGEYAIGDLGTVATDDDVRLWPAGHKPIPLAKDQVVFTLLGPAGDEPSTPTPIGLTVPLPQFFLVKAYKDGGAVGTGSTRSTWTYTVKTLDDVQFKTAVPVYKTRPVGKRDFAVDGRLAVAFYDGETLKLWDVDEVDAGGPC